MPVTVVKGDAAPLWSACIARFSADGRTSPGTTRHTAHIWLTQRSQRDLLLESAAASGHPGWFAPPLSFLSELPKRFHAGAAPIDLLTRRQLISAIATQQARRAGIGAGGSTAIVRGHMLDAVFSELLPEGVTPDRLAELLSHAAADEFAERRNAWVLGVYREYLDRLRERGMYDPRAIHAIIADAIRAGGLRDAIGGAERLHVYGLYSARTRGTLLHALSAQQEVDVSVYVPMEAVEFDELGPIEELERAGRPAILVQPAPDAVRELQWVAARVKELLLAGEEPHQVAVIARTGREDTRAACRHLESAGVPCTARIRRRLAEIPVLSLVLELFRGAGEGWTYRPLRTVIGSSYTRARIDVRLLDDIAGRARPATLAAWEQALEELRVGAGDVEDDDEDEAAAEVRRRRSDRIARHAAWFRELRALLEPLSGTRTERAWVELTRGLLTRDELEIQRSLSRVPHERYDVVRFDQRGFRRFETLLTEWHAVADDAAAMSGAEWYGLLRRMLEGQELVLSTPAQKGVQVLEAQDAALVPFRHTFVIHMNDGVFPARATDGGIFSEEERSALIAAGLPLENRSLALQREHALWRAITTSGTVSASYRTTDPRGTPLLPSLMLPEHDVATELPRSLDLLGEPITRDQTRQAAVQALLDSSGDVRTPERDVIRRAVLHAHAEQSRGVPDRTVPRQATMWNGVIRDPVVLDLLRGRYGPEHIWSASQLQTYTRCPFFFLIDRVLRLRPLDEAEESTSPLEFGGIAHDILERFYATSLDNMPVTLSADVAARLDDAIAAVVAEREAAGNWLGIAALWGVTREGIAAVIRNYVAWELDHMNQQGEQPWRCEYVLQDAAGQPVVITGRDVRGRSVQLRLTGRVDRIDRDRKGRYQVLDYKTSSIPAAKSYRDGVLLQAPLYSEALRQTAGIDVAGARYRALKKPGSPKNGASITVGKDPYEAALTYAFSVPARVHEGLFEAVMAASSAWASWDPDLSVCRTLATLEEGCRFDD
ncbi:MAG TPA: PD-(D/E)XK nuclease family protein [Longimicrobiales bacterium]|nr:PD-(D/E)XK nuclease family protein [Longimicrobiales bacterium]